MDIEAANYSVSEGLERQYSRYTELYERDRDYYVSWYRIDYREILDPICGFIKEYPVPCDEMEKACIQLIKKIFCTDCRFTKLCHLYLAAKIAFTAKLSDSETVVSILKKIFYCQRTFRELFRGALYDPEDPGEGGPWYSDRDECLEAMEYFLYHANRVRLVLTRGRTRRRMIDFCAASDGWERSVLVALRHNDTVFFRKLFQHGVDGEAQCWMFLGGKVWIRSSVYNILRIIEIGNLWKPGQEECREIFLRAVVYVNNKVPTLEAISKSVIRKILYDNHQLPHGIEELEIPKTFKKYLNLEY